ncbi:CWF19-like protein 1 [Ornithodoros turicata]|uniref:CWF19-like protein 1 n=1 Tax=Ornithodoros turicata TaxID=34597 RepID=UPI003138CCEB
MGTPLKILVCGDVNGQFHKLFDRVSNVNKKNGPFDMLLCVGDFFGDDLSEWEEYKSEIRKVPVQTYILGPKRESSVAEFETSDGFDLCPNVMYLGKKGVLTGSSGLKLAYFSGVENPDGQSGAHTFSKTEALQFISPFIDEPGFRGVDILLTSQWPKGVTKYGQGVEESQYDASNATAMLAYFTRPRYHFSSSSSCYYDRLPYRNHQVLREPARHASRFISVASVNNAAKSKWLYAFTIVPMVALSNAELVKQPPDVTECPFTFTQDDLKAEEQDKNSQFFYDLTPVPEKKRKHNDGDRQHNKKKHPVPQGPCWFCLASPEVEKHLVISIGDSFYVALAKGALTHDHVLILPIGHHQSTVEMDQDALEELGKFKEALQKCYGAKKKKAVFFERNYRSSHLQIQVVPLPASLVPRARSVFVDYGQSLGLDLDEIPQNSDLRQIVGAGRPYFYVEVEGTKLLHRIRKSFPLQFGREVLACEELLDIPDRVDWRHCKMTKDEESEVVARFREEFNPFDFTLM